MFEFAALSGYLAAGGFGVLCVLLIAADGGNVVGRFLIAAAFSSALWFGLGAVYYSGYESRLVISGLAFLEQLRNLAWLGVLFAILFRFGDRSITRRIKLLIGFSILVTVAGLATPEIPNWFGDTLFDATSVRKVSSICSLMIATIGLILIEQLIRWTRSDAIWAIKHLCLGLGALFGYDFYLYADAVLFTRIDPDLWAARGAANVATVPLIALAAARNKEWDLNIFVSRRVVFYSSAVVGAGLYLLLVSSAGYYLNTYGGTWGGALRAAVVFAAILFLVSLIFSAQVRSRLRLLLAKHFYKNRYEYGEVWLSFTQKLSATDTDPNQLRHTILRAIADVVDSTGGILWCKEASGAFVINTQWSMDAQSRRAIEPTDPIIVQLEANQETIALNVGAAGNIGPVVASPAWFTELPRAWAVVPILHGDELLAFLVLAEPRAQDDITWEDRDLLRTVGRQAASYLAFLRATEALTEARQFEAFNRLSAFLVHDLKNVVAQLSLVVSNSERHRDNPEFIDDAFTTIGDAVAKVNRMLATLRQESAEADVHDHRNIVLADLIDRAVASCGEGLPRPTFTRDEEPVVIWAHYDSFLSGIQHLIQNAQDATDASGAVSIVLNREDSNAFIQIVDTGCGMDDEFIRDRLFRPFDTTKGKAGMGIGVYESRHIITTMGGRFVVESEPGHGTTIKLWVPCLPIR
ncbi:MAG: putative PEP-CTERM system histidine kinase [Gammaproteobacteria bacterium]|jgi:putative PEP-CTERM system histidine kinase